VAPDKLALTTEELVQLLAADSLTGSSEETGDQPNDMQDISDSVEEGNCAEEEPLEKI